MPGHELTALAYAAARGDRDALTGLIRATQRDLMRFLGPLSSAGDVEDLTQETYLRAVRALPDFAGRSSVRTWLFAIGRRVAEAAEVCGCPVGTIRSRVARAREDLVAAMHDSRSATG